MRQGIDYFTLRQVAEIVWSDSDRPKPIGYAIDQLLDVIFKRSDLTPSCFIKSSSMIYWADVQLKLREENPDWPYDEWETRQVAPDDLPEDVLVDLLLDERSRNTGSASGKFQLVLVPGEKTGRLFAPVLRLPTEKWGYARCQLLSPKEIAESKLVVRHDNLVFYIRNDEEAQTRLEEAVISAKEFFSNESIDALKSNEQYGFIHLFKCLGETSCNPKTMPGLLIKPDGVWRDLLSEDDRKRLTPHELAAIYEPFENHDSSKPVLKFPCTGKELKDFLVATGSSSDDDIEIVEVGSEEFSQSSTERHDQNQLDENADRLAILPRINNNNGIKEIEIPFVECIEIEPKSESEHQETPQVTSKIKRKTPDNTGRKSPFSLQTVIDGYLQAFYKEKERLPGGKSAIGEFVAFLSEKHKANPPQKIMEVVVELRPQNRGDSKRFICLKAAISKKHPKSIHWHGWKTFDSRFRSAMNNFTPEDLPTEKNNQQ